MGSPTLRNLVAGMLLATLCAACNRPDAQSPTPDAFEALLSNPLRQRDHSQQVDRLVLTDTAAAFRAGAMQGAELANGEPPRVVLTQAGETGFPRRGAWTSPETPTELPFTELIPSWNVDTPPETGVFFHVRTRDAASGQWSPWLYVGRWGRTIHVRHDERLPNDRVVRFEHGTVRPDMPLVLLRRPANAYQVRASLQSFDVNPAVSPGLRRVSVAYSGEVAGAAERTRLEAGNEPDEGEPASVEVPQVSQYEAPPPLSEAVCLPACVTMVLNYWNVDRPLTENALAIYDPDTGMFGNGARAVARAGELGLDGWIQRVRDWSQVRQLLRQGLPVIAAVQVQGAQHLIVIRGFTPEGDVIVNDPANRGGATVRKADKLGHCWFDCGGVACVIRRQPAR